MPLGLYISVPFCKTKCSYCNFASDVFSREWFRAYVQQVCAEIARAEQTAQEMGGRFERAADSIYLGGGTPSLLPPELLERVFDAIRGHFAVASDAEITVECAPGTLAPGMVTALVRLGVNRVSLGVQSFVDEEAAAVGRRHTRAIVLDDIARLRDAGIANLNLDLIAGLPHQTAESWRRSLDDAIATGVPHVSVYMLEVDEDSRLGRELIAGGTRYHAHFVPDEDAVADFYTSACEVLEGAGIRQYEISNFARAGAESRHNLKYWTRQPYLGFGVDAHSMLQAAEGEDEAVRFANTDDLEQYMEGSPSMRTEVSRAQALEETFFLGLRLARGVDLAEVTAQFGREAHTLVAPILGELQALNLLQVDGDRVSLTPSGRLLSNEVFERFLLKPAA
jgi:oxygen-independent coproporphyrinogen-3 oxidase